MPYGGKSYPPHKSLTTIALQNDRFRIISHSQSITFDFSARNNSFMISQFFALTTMVFLATMVSLVSWKYAAQ